MSEEVEEEVREAEEVKPDKVKDVTRLFEYIGKRNKFKFSNEIYLVKTFIDAIILILKSDHHQNYLVVTNQDVIRFNAISEQFNSFIKKYITGGNRRVISNEDDLIVIQNLYDWLIKSLKKTVFVMPPPRYQITDHGLVIRTLLTDLEVYASNRIDYLREITKKDK